MTATAAVSPSEYLQPAVSTSQDTQPSPLALLAATCSKIGPPAVETAVTTPVPQRPSRKRLIPIKPAPLPVSPGKTSIGLLNAKGNVIQIPQLGTGNGQLFFTIQNPGGKAGRYQALQTSPQAIQQTVSTQFQIINPNDGATTLQLTPHSSSTKHVPIKPAPPQKNSNVMKLTGTAGNNLTLALPLNNLGDATSEICSQLVPSRQSKKPRKKSLPLGPTPGSPTQEQVETVVIETTADNILQAGNNLLIVQSPNAGQHAVLQLVQPKAETQLVQIPQQALRVVQAASATLPTVPQKPVQTVQSTEMLPTQLYFRTSSGDVQALMVQESTPAPCSMGGTGSLTLSATPTKKNVTRKERSLAKIAPAGSVINLNTAQLSATAQGIQTISINGVPVQGVPVTITNAAGQQQISVQNVSSNNVSISGLSPSQIQLQMEQALSGDLQPGEKRRRVACTCPNCKDGEKG
ncbi:transcription factor Sp2 isoform 3-T3 [Anomaloglossus baeobatrachus]